MTNGIMVQRFKRKLIDQRIHLTALLVAAGLVFSNGSALAHLSAANLMHDTVVTVDAVQFAQNQGKRGKGGLQKVPLPVIIEELRSQFGGNQKRVDFVDGVYVIIWETADHRLIEIRRRAFR